MKLKKLAFVLSMILLLGILVGCTPKTQDSTESYTVPDIQSGTEQLPDNETAAPTGEAEATKSEPESSENGPVPPESESANASEPLSTEPSSEYRPTEPDALYEQPTEDPGEDEEIDSEYSFIIDDGYGVGGN